MFRWAEIVNAFCAGTNDEGLDNSPKFTSIDGWSGASSQSFARSWSTEDFDASSFVGGSGVSSMASSLTTIAAEDEQNTGHEIHELTTGDRFDTNQTSCCFETFFFTPKFK